MLSGSGQKHPLKLAGLVTYGPPESGRVGNKSTKHSERLMDVPSVHEALGRFGGRIRLCAGFFQWATSAF